MAQLFVYPELVEKADLEDVVCRLAWYLTPYLDGIDAIHLHGSSVDLKSISPTRRMDPAVRDGLRAIRDRIQPLDGEAFDERIARIDPAADMLLIRDERSEQQASAPVKAAIGALSSGSGGLYRVDPLRTRTEGDAWLRAGLDGCADRAGLLRKSRARMTNMIAGIGHHGKARVFGDDASFDGFGDGLDFGDGPCVIAASVVRNRDIMLRMESRVIVATDPVRHAGCSSDAGAFREELTRVLRETDAWFVCPLRDFAIYDTALPEDLRPRIVGIPFDENGGFPVDLAETFHLPSGLPALAMLPLASTLAERVEIAGCNGRGPVDDGSDGMRAMHPAFFALDGDDDPIGLYRDIETMVSAMEDAGRTVVTVTPSAIPALHAREPRIALSGSDPVASRTGRPAIRTLVMVDPGMGDDRGYSFAHADRLAVEAQAAGLETVLLCRADLTVSSGPRTIRRVIPCLSVSGRELDRNGSQMPSAGRMILAREMAAAIDRVEAENPVGGICLFVHAGSIEIAEILEYLLIERPRVHAVVNLLRHDLAAPEDCRTRFLLMRRFHGSDRVSLTYPTPRIAATCPDGRGLDIPVLPHPSPTFSDAEAVGMAAMPGRVRNAGSVTTVLVFERMDSLLSSSLRAVLADDPSIRLLPRVWLDPVSGPKIDDDAFSGARLARVIGGADIVVVARGAEVFEHHASGILTDAMLTGKPVVVPERTWLSGIVDADGIGVSSASDPASVVAAIRRVIATEAFFGPALAQGARRSIAENSWKALAGSIVALAHERAWRFAPPAKPLSPRDGPGVFEHRAFDTPFSPAIPVPSGEMAERAHPPKLLLLDMTPMVTDTGEVGSSLLHDWPRDRILQIADRLSETLAVVRPAHGNGGTITPATREETVAAARAFDPDVILYRPMSEVPHLHDMAMELVETLDCTLAMWMTDDRLVRFGDVAGQGTFGPDMDDLLKRSRLHLSTNDALSNALEARYGMPFTSLADGIDPEAWQVPKRHVAGPILVRHATDLPLDTARDSVLRVARAVERLRDGGTDIRFEIRASGLQIDRVRELFAQFSSTAVRSGYASFADRFSWLAGADVLLIAHDFDPATRHRSRYDMAAEMPECLASGAVVLVHGPSGIATVDHLARTGAAVMVTGGDDSPIADALQSLADDPARRNELATRARRYAFDYHDRHRLRARLRVLLARASRHGEADAAPTTREQLDAAHRELAELHKHFVALDAHVRTLEGGGR